jgi:hypothetical protein
MSLIMKTVVIPRNLVREVMNLWFDRGAKRETHDTRKKCFQKREGRRGRRKNQHSMTIPVTQKIKEDHEFGTHFIHITKDDGVDGFPMRRKNRKTVKGRDVLDILDSRVTARGMHGKIKGAANPCMPSRRPYHRREA